MVEPIDVEHLLRLPEKERSRLAKALLESLHQESDDDADARWIEELERRAKDARRNPEELISAADVHARLTAKLRER